jgi:uncharacterized protein
MTVKSIFINEYGRLRSGWRVIAFAMVFFVVLQILGAILGATYYLVSSFVPGLRSHSFVENMIYRILLLVAAVIAGYLCNRWLEGLPFRAFGLSLHRKWFQHLAVGTLFGIVSLAFAVAIATLGGGLSFNFAPRDVLSIVLQTLLSSAALFVVAALAEESIFRGYPLQTLTRAQLAWLGVLLTSLPFAAAHLNNPNAVRLASLNTAIAGVWLAAAYLRSRSLWFPLGVHWAWNWALGSLFGLPVSGITFTQNTLLRATDVGPAWLTGGRYGIEGGVACTIALTLSTLVIWRIRLVIPDDELLRMTSNENPVIVEQPLSVLEVSGPTSQVPSLKSQVVDIQDLKSQISNTRPET